ncbi:FtsX-like permease family protein [Jiangella mangrovi]|uniref:Putative ABC transport system permease protein n=1 Tax=Jiangella mangrovi TaxID=1524084 RepID=A0A7W9LLT7_9ACTN|nr:FtsX-like permease family protein [Jiangella mangrovi]MBB5788560.1 putative ABC transport system permease protein [Jiangella mangrovi]
MSAARTAERPSKRARNAAVGLTPSAPGAGKRSRVPDDGRLGRVGWLARPSLRHRPTAFLAGALTVFLSTAVVGPFAAMIETALHSGGEDRLALLIMGGVVGGWGLVIVLFSLASAVGITVRQRTEEVVLLRTIGAAGSQVRALVRGETLVMAAVAAALGAVPAWFGARALLDALRSGGLVSGDVRFRGGGLALLATVVAIVLVARLAAAVAVARASRAPVREARAAQALATPLPRWRRLVAAALVLYGVGFGVVTMTVTGRSDEPYDAMMTAGNACLLVSIGLAVVAPRLLQRFAVVLHRRFGRGAASELALSNAARRSHLLSATLAPVIVLAGSSIGTLMLVDVDVRSMAAAGGADRVTNLLNVVVVVMISLFAAIMVINAWVAVVADRRAELRRLWLVGAAPSTVRRSVVVEGLVTGVLGAGLGIAAAATTVVPFSWARGEGLVPDGGLWLVPALAAAAVAVAVLSATAAARRVRFQSA